MTDERTPSSNADERTFKVTLELVWDRSEIADLPPELLAMGLITALNDTISKLLQYHDIKDIRWYSGTTKTVQDVITYHWHYVD